MFYTPESITDYICRNTIIPYLSQSGEVKTVHELISEYETTNSLEELDKKLKEIKIVDPACGSGSLLLKFQKIHGRKLEGLKVWEFQGQRTEDKRQRTGLEGALHSTATILCPLSFVFCL